MSSCGSRPSNARSGPGDGSSRRSEHQRWDAGLSWTLDGTYVVVEQSRALAADTHDRLAPGLNHLAFHGGTRDEVDRLVEAAPEHGWALLFPDRHPHAGGPDHYALFCEDPDGLKVELVAADGEDPGPHHTT
jgi:catechol 2,3-dioxygenase-like lactoylglutathione lyase family enzyme